MLKYDEIRLRLDHELRDQEAWPDATSKLAEQLNLLYIAALTIAVDIPLGRLSLADSAALTGTSIGQDSGEQYDAVQKYTLPDDAFDLRFNPSEGPLDYGIAHFLIDGSIRLPSEAISLHAILNLGNRGLQGQRKLLALDYPNDLVYASNIAADLKVHYAAKPTRPTIDDDPAGTGYQVLDFPLANDNDTQRAVHLVAAHVNGVTIRDGAQTQFQALLEQTYA